MTPSSIVDSPLLRWVTRPGATAVRFAAGTDDWISWPYPRLAGHTLRTAAGLTARGVAPGDVVVIVEPTGPRFIHLYFGAMLAGAIPAPATPPAALGQDMTAYQASLRHIVDRAGPRLVATTPALAPVLAGLLGESAGVVPDDELLADEPATPGDLPPADLAMLQFTSGSTGRPRGVRVPFPALEGNIAAIRSWLAMGPDDPTASWLPIHHDMGLIGCLLTPIVTQADLWLLSPQQFVRSPLRYLRCFGEHGARLTAMPTFGLDHIARRVRPADLAGMDFSAWRAVIVGAERVGAGAVARAYDLLGPHGLDRRSLLPAYGLAEATLAVTGLSLAQPWTELNVDGAAVRLDEPAPIDTGPSAGSGLVGCGRPLDGITVRVADAHGVTLPDGRVGEIVVGGVSVTDGYHRADDATSATFAGGELRTGDAGFRHDGQLFVLGRLGDSVKLRGRMLMAEDVEAALEAAGLPRHRQAVLLGMRGDRPTAVLVLENLGAEALTTASSLVRRLTEGADVDTIGAPVGTIPRTTSGKPKRRQLWAQYLSGVITTTGHPVEGRV